MFYSAQTGGFYDAELHGARLTMIQNPAWIRPTRDIILQPGESMLVGDELMTNTGEEPVTLKNVLDMGASPDMLEVANLSCLIPLDAVEITTEHRNELLAGQSLGRVIAPDDSGYPILIDPPPVSAVEQARVERAWRDAQLAPTDGMVSRHRDELEAGIATSLTTEQYAELQAYRRELRDWPQGAAFPLADHRPVAPIWLSGQLQ
ncbi:phage tail assembly chaperone [Pseudomonas sp. NPDC096950]|uniref:phage tail assembly chaperone n=1 Tax=Pseudomonas sp. NPDC096950 TaxID=3364485 RepID=UPI00383B4C34